MVAFSTLIFALAAAASAHARLCGLKIATCPEDEVCVPFRPSCTNIDRCIGICRPILPDPDPVETPTPTPTPSPPLLPINNYRSCGGFVYPPAEPCPKGTKCMDDPRKPGCGMACDMPGICVPTDTPQCAGVGGRRCDEELGLRCYELKKLCNTETGGRDCGGICLYPTAIP